MSEHIGVELRLRPATVNDAQLLHVWRNDPQTRSASRNTSPISFSEHELWLSESLASPDRLMFIVEDVTATAVGLVRADRAADGWELSWMVAPGAHGRGIGSRMVLMFAANMEGRISAVIRRGHVASERIAAAAGLSRIGRAPDSNFELWTRE
jgi:RimJ/RimL family protein N-acetyltransferase